MSQDTDTEVDLDPDNHPCHVAWVAGRKDGRRGIPESRAITNSKQYEDSEGYLEGYYDALSD
jgi:hypothetical protein